MDILSENGINSEKQSSTFEESVSASLELLESAVPGDPKTA